MADFIGETGVVNELTIIKTLPQGLVFAIPVAVIATLAILLFRGWLIRRSARAKNTMASAYSALSAEDDIELLSKRVEAALAADDQTALADLYLALARAHQRNGDEDARMSALRSAAGCAALHGPEATHAAVRMELAEAAYVSGDLSSACEQWHLARGAFLASGQTEEHARVEKRMRENGCPTDWVLTDF
ncbi:hypothetical protein [Hyphomicrobium sp.]|uniref:hypothetical protein n=1 Tax=Hyphomicrobium sp. TaxID=82 RepID=UPI002CDA48CE|nr:hypothetical protein [Hyphomicrobium sp.]HVZ05105.1 hypothetical protein [Hyphomicrobium sp.]